MADPPADPPETDPTTDGAVGTDGTPDAPDDAAGAGGGPDDAPEEPALPRSVQEEAERLTRLSRDAVDPGEAAAYEADRASLLAEYGFTARVRPADDTLVLHPEGWVVDGAVRPDRIDDIDRAVERPLEGTGDEVAYDSVEEHNAGIAERVAAEHGPVHGANARAFADFMGNHYVQRVETATARQVREFLDEYFPRNAWPSDDQRAAVAESVRLVFAVADATPPTF